MFYIVRKVSKSGNAYNALVFNDGENDILITFDRLTLYRLAMATGKNIDNLKNGEAYEIR